MPQRSVTREMPKLSLRASFEPSTVDVEKRTVELTWTTGARVLRGFWESYWEELSLDPAHVKMERLQSGAAPLLNAHGSWEIRDVIGVVESAEIKGKGKERIGTAKVRFDSGPEGEDAFRRVREGTLRNVSVGYATYRMEKVEGGDATIPVYRAVEWEPHEISMVPIGADAGAMTRSPGPTTPCVFVEERAMPDPVPTVTPPAQPVAAAAPAASPVAAPSADQVRAAAEAERARVLGIQRVARKLGRPDAEVAEAIEKGTSLEAYRAAAVDAVADTDTIIVDKRDERAPNAGGVIVAGEDARDKWLRGAEAWIIERAGVGHIVREAAKLRGEKIDLDPGEFRGLRMIDLARQALERGGQSTKGMLSQDLVGKAFTQQRSGGYAATGDFPILQENVLNKILLAAHAVTPDKWSIFCSRGSVSDFKAHKRYRVGSFGALSAVNENGEFANKSIPDGTRESQQAATKGNIIGITRQAIINDDLSAFSTLATALGRGAKLTVEVDVFALLALNAGLGPTMTDGLTLFHANHGNIGTGAALSAASLDLDRTFMGLQTDPSGNELLELRPAILLVPITLGGQARVINDSPYDPDTVANKAQMKANIAGKMFRDIVDTGRMTGTRRYLFADPNIAPVIEVAFLDGQEQPFLEMKDGWRTDGVEWKVRLDFGVAAIDHRGAVTNAGV